jgi:hypothetical protein
MKDVFPDFPVQLWCALEKYKWDETHPLSSYYSTFCDFTDDQVLTLFTLKLSIDNFVNIQQMSPKQTVRVGKKRKL